MITNNKIVFRFLFLYFALYIFPWPADVFPFTEFINEEVTNLYLKFFDFVSGLFGYETNFTNDWAFLRADFLYSYFFLAFIFIVGFIGTIIWSLVEKRSKNYEKLNYWFLVLLRFYVGVVMLDYGLDKVIPNQMSGQELSRLMLSYGESSKMGLLWNFMNLSYFQGYKIFAGLAELLGALLLFHRRTTLLGALILFGVLTNVVLINFFYGVPVKIISSHLLIMTVLIILPDLKRLIRAIFNQKTEPRKIYRPVFSGKLRYASLGFKWIFIVSVIGLTFKSTLDVYLNYPPYNNPPLFGVYEVKTFVLGNDTIPPSADEPKRWRYLIRDNHFVGYIFTTDGLYRSVRFKADTAQRKLLLKGQFFDKDSVIVDYDFQDKKFFMRGLLGKDSLFVSGIIKNPEDFRIHNRSFQWYYDPRDNYTNTTIIY